MEFMVDIIKENNPKVSIIIPVYNVEGYLPFCLESLVNQTYPNLEIICVNDGSSDNSLNILKQYASKDERFVIIDKVNEGVSIARNTALQSVKGEYIVFVDADDWLDENYVEIMLKTAKQHNADVVMCTYVKEYDDHSSVSKIFDEDELILSDSDVQTQIRKRMFGLSNNELSHPERADVLATVWKQIIKTEISKEKSFFDIRKIGTFEDGLFQIDLYKDVKKFVYINKPLYHYRKTNSNSITSGYKSDLFTKWQYLYDVLEEKITDENLSNQYVSAFNNRICLGVLGLGFNEISNKDNIFKKAKNINKILKKNRYRKAFNNLEFKYLPIHWKVFFGFCKYRLAFGVVLMLYCINYLRKRLK